MDQSNTSSRTRTTVIGETGFVYDDHGEVSPHHPPLVLLHGAVQNRHVWGDQVSAFAETHRVIAPDLRGHGETTGPIHPMTIKGHAKDVVDLLDALDIRRAIICGVSLGGMVALSVAARSPERVAGLVLADTPLALSMTGIVRTAIERLGPQRILWPFFSLLGRKGTARLGLILARALLGRAWVGPKAGELFVSGFSAMSREAIVETYAAIVAADPVPLDVTDRPSLVVIGRHETGLVVSQAGEIARRLGRCEIVTVGGGHVPNVDSPDDFNAAVRRFLDSLKDP